MPLRETGRNHGKQETGPGQEQEGQDLSVHSRKAQMAGKAKRNIRLRDRRPGRWDQGSDDSDDGR